MLVSLTVSLAGLVGADGAGPQRPQRRAQVPLAPRLAAALLLGRVDAEPVRALPQRRRRDAERR